MTRALPDGYVRASVKYIDDRNQFILPMPFADPDHPDYVLGLSDYGSMNTPEGVDVQVPTPTGDLTLPLDNGLKTAATWFTVDAALGIGDGWRLQNTIQAMQNDQEWNGLVPTNAFTVDQYVTGDVGEGGLGLPPGTTIDLTYTNHFDDRGDPLPFDTPNGLVAPGGQWYIDKPISAIHDQLQLRRTFGPHTLALGAYFANYTEDNHWYFTDLLTDVRDIPRFLDAVVTVPGGAPTPVTNMASATTCWGMSAGPARPPSSRAWSAVSSSSPGGCGRTWGSEWSTTTTCRPRRTPTSSIWTAIRPTTFDNVQFGNNSFRHFSRSITDWAGSLGLNFGCATTSPCYAAGSRGYKMPALDDFLNAVARSRRTCSRPRRCSPSKGE